MSYETFKKGLTDRNDGCYMDMERLMNTVYPLEKVNEIWPLDQDGIAHLLAVLLYVQNEDLA